VTFRRRNLFTLLNLHLLLAGCLLVLNLVLAGRLFLAWRTFDNAGPEELGQEQARYRTLALELRPLSGLPQKVAKSRSQADGFYADRIPAAYSIISAAMNDLADQNNVRVTRVSYIQEPALPNLAMVRVDASLSGEYAPLMRCINALERSKTFFLINGLTLTGQQGGLVNLRLRMTTYLHGSDLEHALPPGSGGEAAAPQQPGGR
jgi:hypothetical protein